MVINRQYERRIGDDAADVGRAPTWRWVVRLLAAAATAAWAATAAAQSCTGLNATNLVFTGYSPFGSGVLATSTITYRCDPGVTQAWIGISRPRVLRSGGNQLQFDIYPLPDRATPWPETPALPLPVAANGSITAYGFLPAQNAAAGNYTAMLFVTINSLPGRKAPSTPMQVRANVAPVCQIEAGALAFGDYDPVVTNAVTPLDGQGTFQIRCTGNTPYTVALGPGLQAAGTTRRMAGGAGNAQRLQYELYSDAGRSTVWNATSMLTGTATSTAPITLTVYGRIPPAQPVGIGAYSDVVQSTINF
jgi:spore coat protein U-like protein